MRSWCVHVVVVVVVVVVFTSVSSACVGVTNSYPFRKVVVNRVDLAVHLTSNSVDACA